MRSSFLVLATLTAGLGCGAADSELTPHLRGEVSGPIDVPTEEAPADPPGTESLDVNDCAGRGGHPVMLPGNVSTPVASFSPDDTYFAWISDEQPPRVVASKYDGETCTPATRVNDIDESPVAVSHDAPSVHVDGDGYVYVTYFGSVIYANSGDIVEGPYMRRTVRPGDLTEWTPEGTARLFNLAELHSVRLEDDALLLAGSDFHGRIDIIEPGGAYRWPAARQVVTQVDTRDGSNNGQCKGNRFTKTVFQSGPDGTLYALWGWAGGGSPTGPRPTGCNDVRHYSEDSHEVFFAYSEDGGLTWHNHDGTRTVEAPLCYTKEDCQSVPTAGIQHNDPDFILTDTRQLEHRKLWATTDGTIYVAFARSEWCDRGMCETRNATSPGALTLLKFRLGGEVEEMTVDTDGHYYIGGIRKMGNALYIWASTRYPNQHVYEYVSHDDGRTWSRQVLGTEKCNRLHGQTREPGVDNSVRMVFMCSEGDEDRMYYHRRTH